MVSFELGKEKKAFFVSSRAWDRENIFSPQEASEGLRFDASWGLRIFSLSHACDETKNIVLYFFWYIFNLVGD